MIDHLPDRLDLLATAAAGRVLRGQVPLASLKRALSALQSTSGNLQVVLELGRDINGTHYLAGSLQGVVALRCERCLGQLVMPLDIDFRLGLVRSDEESVQLSDGYEPLLVSAEPAVIAEILSDEVLLALPIVPVHGESEKCQVLVKNYQPPAEEKRKNPFAVLAELKHRRQ